MLIYNILILKAGMEFSHLREADRGDPELAGETASVLQRTHEDPPYL
jgi:hypothetical protein